MRHPQDLSLWPDLEEEECFQKDQTVEEEDMDGVQNTLSTANTLINEDKKDTIKGRTPGLGGFMAVLSNTFKTTVEKVQEDMSDSTEEDEQDYDELIREPHYDLSGLPSHVQLLGRQPLPDRHHRGADPPPLHHLRP